MQHFMGLVFNNFTYGDVTKLLNIFQENVKSAKSVSWFWKAYSGERTRKAIEDRLQGPCYLSRDNLDRKIRARK